MARILDKESEITLPGQILDQIRSKEESGDYDDARFGQKRRQVSRKDKRKQERTLKKQKHKQLSQKQKQNQISQRSAQQSSKQTSISVSEDPIANLKALKANKNGSSTKKAPAPTPIEEDDLDDFGGFEESEDNVDDPLAALQALKAKKRKTEISDIRIVKEDDIDDEMSDFDDFLEDEGSDTDPMEALRALKSKKASNDTVRVVKEDELDDDFDSDDFDDFEDEDNDEETDPMAALKALKEKKGKKEAGDENSESDFDLDEEDFNEDIMESDISEEEDPIAKLKALKESKKEKKGKKDKKEKVVEAEFVDPFDNDLEYYSKKLKLKDTRKLPKLAEDDGMDDLLDGINFDYLDKQDSEDSEPNSDDFDSEFSGSEDEAPRKKENPFVAPTGNISEDEEASEKPSKYIPPAMRRKLALESGSVSAETLALQKSIKGPINKLSEANIGTIVNELNGLFLNNARQSVNENITNIILDSIIQQGRLLDTFVYLHATLVVALYRLQGVDFGAFFVQTLIEKFELYLADSTKSKEVLNVVSLLSSVYAFQLVSSKILYDVIKVLIEDLTESNAELLLKIVRNSGNQMRADDPSALKEIVLQVTKKAGAIQKDKVSTRMLFLIETITSLKNNKLKSTNEGTHQLTLRLKKFLGTFASNKFTDPIQVTLDDIRNVETKGKWWLVGSAWKGNEDSLGDKVNTDVMNDILDNAEPNWLELAKAQRMNTDIRRAIFISIMSANDFMDAVTKLDKLALRRAQEREIPRILIHCAVVEPAWNPYYGMLASKLCDSHSYRKTFQFMLWDLTKSFEGADGSDSEDEEGFNGFDNDDEDDEDKLKKILNLGRLFGFLFAEGSLALHILRTINFVTASADNRLFLEVLFVTFIDQIAKKSQVNAVGAGLLSGSKKGMSEVKFDDRTLIERLLKAKEQPALLRGMQLFILKRLRNSDFVTGKRQRKRIEWGINAMHDIVDEFVKENSL